MLLLAIILKRISDNQNILRSGGYSYKALGTLKSKMSSTVLISALSSLKPWNLRNNRVRTVGKPTTGAVCTGPRRGGANGCLALCRKDSPPPCQEPRRSGAPGVGSLLRKYMGTIRQFCCICLRCIFKGRKQSLIIILAAAQIDQVGTIFFANYVTRVSHWFLITFLWGAKYLYSHFIDGITKAQLVNGGIG